MFSPSHTLASITYLVGDDTAFVHDTLMYPDSGTSRADFPGGDAATLYQSIQAILKLPNSTRLFVGHDYCKDGREPQWEATVAQQRAENLHVKDGISESKFVKLRTERDRTLPLPDRMLHALQVNLRGGRLPRSESDGHHYLRIPVDRFLNFGESLQALICRKTSSQELRVRTEIALWERLWARYGNERRGQVIKH